MIDRVKNVLSTAGYSIIVLMSVAAALTADDVLMIIYHAGIGSIMSFLLYRHLTKTYSGYGDW